MDIHATLNYIENTCNKYDFWNRKIMPYSFGIEVKRIFSNWKDYDLCTRDSQSVIKAEIRGFLPTLEKWVEFENEPKIKIKITAGQYTGQTREIQKSVANSMIEVGFAEAI